MLEDACIATAAAPGAVEEAADLLLRRHARNVLVGAGALAVSLLGTAAGKVEVAADLRLPVLVTVDAVRDRRAGLCDLVAVLTVRALAAAGGQLEEAAHLCGPVPPAVLHALHVLVVELRPLVLRAHVPVVNVERLEPGLGPHPVVAVDPVLLQARLLQQPGARALAQLEEYLGELGLVGGISGSHCPRPVAGVKGGALRLGHRRPAQLIVRDGVSKGAVGAQGTDGLLQLRAHHRSVQGLGDNHLLDGRHFKLLWLIMWCLACMCVIRPLH